MKCKSCGTWLTANTLRKCPQCSESNIKPAARKHGSGFGIINRAFEIAVMPMKVSETAPELMFLSVPIVVFLGLVVAVLVSIYAITILPVVLAYRWLKRSIG